MILAQRLPERRESHKVIPLKSLHLSSEFTRSHNHAIADHTALLCGCLPGS
jgi:hypothetical protein